MEYSGGSGFAGSDLVWRDCDQKDTGGSLALFLGSSSLVAFLTRMVVSGSGSVTPPPFRFTREPTRKYY